jgi:plasmid stabilization system protein ParE
VKVQVTRRAQGQIDRAAAWWDENRPLAPGAFDEDLSEAFSLLSVQSAVGTLVVNARTQGVRRLHLARIHYYHYYRVRGGKVQVLSIWHTARGRAPTL